MKKLEKASSPQDVKCKLCNDTGWIHKSDFKNKTADYEVFKITLFVECPCRKEEKAG